MLAPCWQVTPLPHCGAVAVPRKCFCLALLLAWSWWRTGGVWAQEFVRADSPAGTASAATARVVVTAAENAPAAQLSRA